jgi:CRP/FNR family cyclic AMP-dependent transcriptional regulator
MSVKPERPFLRTEQDVDGALPTTDALPPELLAEMLRHGMARSYPRNTIVVSEGEPALSMYVVQEGSLRVYVSAEDGRDVELNLIGPGEYFGELMLDGQTRSASVKTLTSARLCMIGRPEFERILGERPDIAFHVIQVLIHRVRLLSRNVQALVSMDVYGRVSRLFQELARDDGEQRVVPGPLSQQAIADRVGASRSMINRVLKELSGGGYITVSREQIVLNRPLPKRW